MLFVRQTWMTELILVISLWGVILFNPKRFDYSFAWSCSLCERKASFCTGLISRKLGGLLLMFSTGFTSLSVLLLFPLSITFFIVMHGFLFLHRSANVFVFGDIHHKDWLTYSGGADRSEELFYNFSISNDLTQIFNFPTLHDCDCHSLALLDFFLSSDTSICSTMAFPPLGILIL